MDIIKHWLNVRPERKGQRVVVESDTPTHPFLSSTTFGRTSRELGIGSSIPVPYNSDPVFEFTRLFISSWCFPYKEQFIQLATAEPPGVYTFIFFSTKYERLFLLSRFRMSQWGLEIVDKLCNIRAWWDSFLSGALLNPGKGGREGGG